MTVRVLKWDVPVDDHVHRIGSGDIIHVACQSSPDVVQVWTEEVDEPNLDRRVTVVGTGHVYPSNKVDDENGHWHAVGTALTNIGLVWHVLKFIPCRGGDEPQGYIKGSFTTCTREENHAS
jgi:hypothetical protein